MKYDCPILFGKIDRNKNVSEFKKEELFTMLIDSARNGEYISIEEFVRDYDDLLACV